MGLKSKLFAATAAPLALGFAPALAQLGNTGPVPQIDSAALNGANELNSWTTSVFLNTTDNFARTVEGDFTRLFINPDGSFLSELAIIPLPEGGFTIGEQLVEDTVPLEPFSKAFTTLTFDGLSLVDRRRYGGILRGRLRVGAYFNEDTINDVFADEINSNLPQSAIDAGATPTVGDPGGRQFFVDPSISGLFDVDLLGDIVGLEVGGFAIEQNRLIGGQLQAQQPGQDINEVILGGVFVSPVAVFELPKEQAIELRARHSAVRVIDQFENTAVRQIREVADSTSNEVSATYATGDLFGGLDFELQTFARRLVEEGTETDPEQELEQASASFGASIPVTGDFALTGVFGYDDITLDTEPSPILDDMGLPVADARSEDLSGTFFSGGFDYSPTRNARIALSIGQRFQGRLIQGNVRLPLTARVSFAASATRNVTTGSQAIQDELQQFNVQSVQFIDSLRRTNRNLSDRSLARTQYATNQGFTATGRTIFGVQRLSQYRASLQGAYARTSWTLGGAAVLFDDPEEGETRRFNPFAGQYSSFASVTRRMSRRFTVSASGQTLILDAAGEQQGGGAFAQDFDSILDQFYTLQFNYTINRDWGLAFGYTHLRRDVQGREEADVQSLFGGSFFEYRENQLRGGVQFVF